MGDGVPPRPSCYCICDHNRAGNVTDNTGGGGMNPRPGPPPGSPQPGSGGNVVPTYWGPIKQLWSRTGFNLAIDPSGRVFGAPEPFNPLAILHFSSAGEMGEVQIFAVEAKLYLAMDRNGKLYGEPDVKNSATIFVENFDRNTNHNNYLSLKYAHMGWYVGIKKSAKPKPGPKTAFGQKAIQFLPRQAQPGPSTT